MIYISVVSNKIAFAERVCNPRIDGCKGHRYRVKGVDRCSRSNRFANGEKTEGRIVGLNEV